MDEPRALKLLIIASFPAGALIFFVATFGLMAVLWGPFQAWMGGDPAGFGIAAAMAGIFGAALILLASFFWLHNFLVKRHLLPAHSALGLIAGPIVAYLAYLNSAEFINPLVPNYDLAMIFWGRFWFGSSSDDRFSSGRSRVVIGDPNKVRQLFYTCETFPIVDNRQL